MPQSNEVLGYRTEDIDTSITQFQSVVIVGSTPQTISFPDQFFSHAISLVVDNRDGLNALQYRINSDISTPKTVGPGETETISQAKIVLLQILPGSLNWEVQAQVYPRVQQKVNVRSIL